MNLIKFDQLISNINKTNRVLMVASIVIMFIVLLAQIGSRFIFFIPLPWSQDILVFFLVASVFMGVGNAVAVKKEISLEFMVHSLPEKIRNRFFDFADLVSLIFLGVIIYHSIILIEKTKDAMVGASPIPLKYYYLIVAIGCFMMIINYIDRFIKRTFVAENKEEK